MDSNVTVLPNGYSRPERFDATLKLAQLSRLLLRNLWLIGLCSAGAAGSAIAYVHTLPKTYTANGLLALQGDQFAIPQLRGALRDDNMPDPMPVIRTEVQALSSYALVASVASKLNLANDPEFNPALRLPTIMERLKSFVGGLVADLLPSPASTGTDEPPSDEPVVMSVQKAMSTFQDNRSLAIALGFTARDPQLAARFVNTLIQTYVATRANRRGTANADANATLVERIAKARADLQDIEQQMATLRSQGDMVGVRAGSVGQQQVEELTTAAARVTLERTQLELNYGRATAAAKTGSADTLASVLTSPTISQLRERVAAASQHVAELSIHSGPTYPTVRAAAAQVAEIQSQLRAETSRIVDSLGAQLQVARDQETDVKRQLEAARRQAVMAENAHAQLDQLQQEATTRRALYQTLLESEQQTVARPAGSETPDVRVLSPAIPPAFPSGPNLKIAGLMGGVGGALLGCLLALTRMSSVRGLETPEELSRATGLLVVANLPLGLVRNGSGLLALRGPAAAAQGPDAACMRTLHNRLRFAGRTEVPRCILFLPDTATSSHASLAAPISACFARAVAATGQRVLLIEADLQGASLAGPLGIRSSRQAATGIRSVLDGQDWRDAIVEDAIPGLDLLLATSAAQQRQRLMGVSLDNLLIEARNDYDLVVLNGPAPDSVDALALVQRADIGVVIVDGRRDRERTYQAAQHLTPTPTPVVAVLVRRS